MPLSVLRSKEFSDAPRFKLWTDALCFRSGLWQKINSTITCYRNRFVHSGVTISDRFPPVSLAEDAISTIQKAIHEIYAQVGKHPQPWIDHDQSEGWQERGIVAGISGAHSTVLHAGANPETPGVVKIVLVTQQGEERATRYLPPTTSDDEVFWWVEDYLGKLNVPFKAIRVYRGPDLISDESIEVR